MSLLMNEKFFFLFGSLMIGFWVHSHYDSKAQKLYQSQARIYQMMSHDLSGYYQKLEEFRKWTGDRLFLNSHEKKQIQDLSQTIKEQTLKLNRSPLKVPDSLINGEPQAILHQLETYLKDRKLLRLEIFERDEFLISLKKQDDVFEANRRNLKKIKAEIDQMKQNFILKRYVSNEI
jgi:hypothetical protein